MGRILAMVSGTGGGGKSALTARLGLTLNRMGKTVALVDANSGLRCLDLLMGMQDRVVYDLCDVAQGVCRLRQAVIKDREHEGLSLVPASQNADGAPDAETLSPIARQLAGLYDYVLLDCPTGAGTDAMAVLGAAQETVLVTLDDAVCLRDAERMSALSREAGAQQVYLVVNRMVRSRETDARERAREIAQQIDAELLGIVPEDGAGFALPYGQRGISQEALDRIARRLQGETVEIPPLSRHARSGRYR